MSNKLLTLGCVLVVISSCAIANADRENRITLESAGWKLVGDLRIPDSGERVPAVLLLNQAAGSRQVYEDLAASLAKRGVASLRLDLRGHGESTNLGRFTPPEIDEHDRETMIWRSDIDITAAHQFLKSHERVDPERIGMVGASYSGEEMAEAGRTTGYANAYVALSPGSFSDASVKDMDQSGSGWLFVVTQNDPFLHDIAAAVQSTTQTVEVLYLPGSDHATDILESRPDMSARIAVWLVSQL